MNNVDIFAKVKPSVVEKTKMILSNSEYTAPRTSIRFSSMLASKTYKELNELGINHTNLLDDKVGLILKTNIINYLKNNSIKPKYDMAWSEVKKQDIEWLDELENSTESAFYRYIDFIKTYSIFKNKKKNDLITQYAIDMLNILNNVRLKGNKDLFSYAVFKNNPLYDSLLDKYFDRTKFSVERRELLQRVKDIDSLIEKLSERRYIILDTETTDLSNSTRPVQVAGIICNSNYEIIDVFSKYIQQDFISPSAYNVHKIDKDFLETYGENPVDVFNYIMQYIKPSDFIIAHNAQFDAKVMRNLYYQVTGEVPNMFNQMIYLDSAELAGLLKPRPEKRNLTYLRENYIKDHSKIDELIRDKFGEDNLEGHNAIYDVCATYVLLKENLPDVLSW